MNAVDDAIVQQLLLFVVQDRTELFVPQPGVLPDLLQGIFLQQAAVFKNSHQQVLDNKGHTITNT